LAIHRTPRFDAHRSKAAPLDAVGTWKEKKSPLFRSVDQHRELTQRPMHRHDVLGIWYDEAKSKRGRVTTDAVLSYLQGGGNSR
jgi:hypothetical protein